MIRGFYTSASSLIAGLFRQELISHNLANIDVAGFKEVTTSLDEFEQILLRRFAPEPVGGGPGSVVGKTSLGVITSGPATDFSAGPLRQTQQPFDLAIAGEGFFTLQTADGDRYTRDGRFTRDENGHLVSVDGHLLLGADGQPVTVPQGIATISPDGTVTVDDQEFGQISIMAFDDPEADLRRDGQNTFAAVNEPQTSTDANIRQGYLEMSNVDPIRTMTQMMIVARAYEAAQHAIQLQDEMLGKAVNEIGQV